MNASKKRICFFPAYPFSLLCMKFYQLFIKFFYRISGFINVLELVNQTLGMNFHYARHPYKSPSLGDSLSLHDDSVILHERRPHMIEDQGGGEIGVIAATIPVLNTQKKEKEKLSNYVA